jgi:hypothetical protein
MQGEPRDGKLSDREEMERNVNERVREKKVLPTRT